MKPTRILTLAVIALAAVGLRADTASTANNKNATAQTSAAPATVAKAEPQRLLLSQDEVIEGKLNANVLLIEQTVGDDIAIAAISKTTGRTYAKANPAQIASIKQHGLQIERALSQIGQSGTGFKQLHVVSTQKVAMNGTPAGQTLASNGSSAPTPTAAASP